MTSEQARRLHELMHRLHRFRGPYLGDGVKPGITRTELLEFLSLLSVSQTQPKNT